MNISFSVEYEEPILDSEDTSQPLGITGLSSFLALALMLEIPILSAEVSRERLSTSNLGSGASFQVGRSLSSSKRPEISYVGPNVTIGGNPGGLGDRVKTFKELVSKRIRLKSQDDVLDDRQRLAPMVREMRILGHRTLRNHDNIVRMLCLDWSGDSADLAGDRCWPSLLLECASHGTLDNYLTQAQQSSWDTKWMLFFNIVAGVLVLHEHGIAHCDLKPENILVFDKSVVGFDTVNVAAKICDFGFSVITSDFDEEEVFYGRAGTPPWNAPEIAFGLDPKIYDLYKADIYSLGLIFCTIVLDGRTPWQEISTTAFQALREMDDDAPVSEVLQGVLLEMSAGSEHQQEWAERILNSTVKTSPTDRTSASELLSIITMAFLSHIWKEEEEGTKPDKQGDFSLPEGVGEVAVMGKAHALSLLKGQRNPVIPLPDMSSDNDSSSDDSSLSQGVPDFEFPNIFRPCLLYKHALREVTDDLGRRADGQCGDPKEIISEVEYQLAICYLEGYGVEKSSTKGLEYLKRAFKSGSVKARYATRNFYEAFGHRVPLEIESTEKDDLLHLAIDELGRVDEVPGTDFAAIKSLLFLYPSTYRELMCSDAPRTWKLLRFFMKFQLEGDNPSSDSMAEDFHKVTISPPYTPSFDIPVATVFFQFIKELGFLNKFDSSGLTMLHHAAAKGDVGLVKLLLELGTDVNILTPNFGWTPLWVACEVGCFEVANELIANGADLRCRENKSGRSILHLLSRFQSPKEIGYLIKKARESGLELEDLDSAGKTPLQVTFLDWDVSRGLAAKTLLEMGSNPFLKNPEGWDSVVACVEILDPDLLRETLSCPVVQDVPDEVVYKSLARALGSIISKSPIFHISWLGKRREIVIKDILTQLLSDESVKEYLLQEESLGMSPLTGAIFLDRDALVLWLLDLRPQDINLRGENSRTSLQWAIQRNRLDIVQNLLKHGADPLISDGLGFNALHVAAIFVPSIMVNLADAIVQMHCGGDFTTAKPLLEKGENGGYACFAIAVLEGSDEHLRFAEKLRSKYSLDHDSWIGSSLTTLLGFIVAGGALFDICNTAQIEYLLHLSPKPRFVAADREGYTLLHLAVFGWKNADFSDGAAGYEILSLILREFPLLEHVQASARTGVTPIMMAAGCANHIAIKKIRDHATTHGFSLDINIAEEEGLTALDIVGGHSMALALETVYQGNPLPLPANPPEYIPQDFEKVDRLTKRILSKNIIQTYEILLQMGAARSADLDGISIWTLIASPTSVPNEQLISFLVDMKETHAGLNFDRLDENEDSVVSEGSCVSLECSWRVTEFFLSIKIFEDITEAKEHAIERMGSGKKLLEFWTEEDDEAPWSITEYSRRYFNEKVSWQRKGKIWSTDEILELHHQVGLEWQKLTPSKSLTRIITLGL